MTLEEEMNSLALSLVARARDEECSLSDRLDVFKVVTAWYAAQLKPDRRERDRTAPAGTFEDLLSRMNGSEAHE